MSHFFSRSRLAPSRGFTIIEAMVSFGVFILLMIAIVGLYLEFSLLYTLSDSQTETLNRTRTVMTNLALYAPQARQVLVSYTVSTTTFSSNTTTLVLQLPAIDSNGNILSNAWDYAIFYLKQTNLYELVQPAAGSARPAGLSLLADNVLSLSFTFNNSDWTQVNKITVDLQTKTQNSRVTVINHEAQQFILKNF